MVTCPFSSTIDSGGLRISGCLIGCELNLHGQCVFAILGNKVLNEAKFDIKNTEVSSSADKE